MIESFAFGSLVIDGETYRSDLIIYPDGRITDNWWRRSGHRLSVRDIAGLIQAAPVTIIAGTGINGYMLPDEDLEGLLKQKGIVFIAAENEIAVQRFNHMESGGRVGACFHLTC